MDVSEIPRRLTEALVAELSLCVAFGWSLYKIFSVGECCRLRERIDITRNRHNAGKSEAVVAYSADQSLGCFDIATNLRRP